MHLRSLWDRFNSKAHDWLFRIQIAVSSPLWFFGWIILTVCWMTANALLPHPLDRPDAGYPITILLYTLMSLWVENAMKVAQAVQQSQMQAQMDRIEEVARETHKQTDILHRLTNEVIIMTRAIQASQDEAEARDLKAEQRDMLNEKLIMTVEDTVDNLAALARQGSFQRE